MFQSVVFGIFGGMQQGLEKRLRDSQGIYADTSSVFDLFVEGNYLQQNSWNCEANMTTIHWTVTMPLENFQGMVATTSEIGVNNKSKGLRASKLRNL